MKNKLFKAAALCCAFAFLGSCSKDKSPSQHQDASPSTSNDPVEQLKIFRSQLKTAKTNAKNNETITLSDALWGIENNFNLTYADVEAYYSQMNDHEFDLYLPVNNDQKVLVDDVASLYSEVTSTVRDAMASDVFDDKGFVSLNILETEEENGTMRIRFSGKTGEKTNYIPPTHHVYGPFDWADNWMYRTPLGKCDDPDIPSGADEQLQEKLYVHIIEPLIETSPGYRNIYIDRKRYIFDGTNYTGVFYREGLTERCIDHSLMNLCFMKEKNIINNIIPAQYHLEDYVPISIEIRGMAVSNPSAITHRNTVEYGIKVRISTDEFGEIEDL